MVTLTKDWNGKIPLMREVLGDTLVELAKEDPRVVAFDADLMSCSGLARFHEAYPERMFDCGIQEANMVGVAAAMSEAGCIPFTHTFSPFASRKCVDQIFMAACYPGLNIKMIGSDPGITAATNGGSHMGMEDMGILMGLPNITLIDPCDSVMLREVLRQAKDQYGVFYIREYRKGDAPVYEEGSAFELGKGNVLREGRDVTIIASGIEVRPALEAAGLLEQERISARVVDLFTWRPIDRELISRCARETGAIVTAENHAVASGLGRAVAAVTAEECPVPMGYIGVQERYGEVGDLVFLMEKFGMTARDIAEKAKRVIVRKGT